jgi:hypothetical protein
MEACTLSFRMIDSGLSLCDQENIVVDLCTFINCVHRCPLDSKHKSRAMPTVAKDELVMSR